MMSEEDFYEVSAENKVREQADTIEQLQALVRTLWNCGNFTQSVGNALSEDHTLRAALAAAKEAR